MSKDWKVTSTSSSCLEHQLVAGVKLDNELVSCIPLLVAVGSPEALIRADLEQQ